MMLWARVAFLYTTATDWRFSTPLRFCPISFDGWNVVLFVHVCAAVTYGTSIKFYYFLVYMYLLVFWYVGVFPSVVFLLTNMFIWDYEDRQTCSEFDYYSFPWHRLNFTDSNWRFDAAFKRNHFHCSDVYTISTLMDVILNMWKIATSDIE